MKKLLIICTCLFTTLVGCSKESESTLDEMLDYNLLDYLPSKPGTFREYITYGTEKEGGIVSRDYLNDIEQTGSATDTTPIYTYDFDYTIYFTDEPSKMIEQKRTVEASENAIFTLHNLVEHANLKKKLKWERDEESVIELVNANVDMSTKVGEFSNCIEVIETVTYESEKGVQKKVFHCPKVGEVSTYLKTSDQDDFELFSELIYVSIPGELELGEQYLIGMSDDAVEGDTRDVVVENPITSLKSGVLPSKTNKVSTLNFYNYRDRVNEYSLESIGYTILNNPINFVENEGDILLEFDDGISIIVEKDTYLIKEISINHNDYISEVSFIYARDLIMGLAKDITIEQADEILYPEKEGKIFELECFSIGNEIGESYFNFLAVAK